MERVGKVSLWLGNFSSEVDLKNYVCLGYTADGDQIYSVFANEFDFGHTDDDSIEYKFFNEEVVSIDKLLKLFSYSEIITSRFQSLRGKSKLDKPVNSVILLYDYEHEENIIQGNNVEYVGCISYV